MKQKLLIYFLLVVSFCVDPLLTLAQEGSPSLQTDSTGLDVMRNVTVVLKDKRVIRGKLINETNDHFRIMSEAGITYQLPRSIVQSIDMATRFDGPQTRVEQNGGAGTYFSIHAGYGLSAGSQLLDTKSSSNNREGIYGSFGEGFRISASVGHMFSSNVGAELGVSYLLGRTFESGTTTETVKRSGAGLLIVPTILIAGSGMSTVPYARVGIVIGLVSVKNEVSIAQQQEERTIEEKGGLGFGYAGGLGLVFASGSSVSFFAEVSLTNVAYSPSEREITAYTVNGQDRLAQLTNKKAEFKDNYTTPAQNTLLGVREPFGGIGANVGVRITL